MYLIHKVYICLVAFLLLNTLHIHATKNVNQSRIIKLRDDISFEEQINQANTTYEIQYDFNLRGRIIIVPEGCTFFFNGGTLNNGTLKGDKTEITAGRYIIFKDISIEGNWNVEVAYPEWFGAKGDGKSDDSHAIQACLDAPFCKIVFQNKESPYMVANTLVVNRPVNIEGGYGYGADTYTKIQAINRLETIFFLKEGCVRSSFSNLYIDGNYKCGCGFYSPQGGYDSYIHGNTFTNIKVVFVEYGFRLNKIYSCVFNTCQCNSISRIGFCFNKDLSDGTEGTTITAINCGSSTWNEKGGIGWYFKKMTYCSLISCGSDDNDIAYQFKDCSNFSLISCGCEKTGTPLLFDYDGYSMGFTINSFRITALKEKAPYDWILYSGGLYNTTITGVHINSENKRNGDIYTRYAASSITILDKSSISPEKCVLTGTAVLFPSLNISDREIPDFEGQLYVDSSRMAIANKKSGKLVWNTIYSESIYPISWSYSNAVNCTGGYRVSGKIVFVNLRFTSKVSSQGYRNLADDLPFDEIGESFLKITDIEGKEIEDVKAKVSSRTLKASGLIKGTSYLITGFYFTK